MANHRRLVMIFAIFHLTLVEKKFWVSGSSCVLNPGKEWRYCEPTYVLAFISCYCHYINYKGQGDGDCSSKDENGNSWCYVIGSESACEDKEWSAHNGDFPWNYKGIYYSYEACKGFNLDGGNVGNEAFSLGVELIGGSNMERNGNSRLYAPSPEACETECYVNKKDCAAWTFYHNDNGDHACYLILGDAEGNEKICFNQDGAKRKNARAVSGFICETASKDGYACWSTIKDKRLDVCPEPEGKEEPVFDTECDSQNRCQSVFALAFKLSVSSTVGSYGATKARGRYRRRHYTFVNGRWRAVYGRRRSGR